MAGKPAAGEKKRGRPRKKGEGRSFLSPSSLAPGAARRQPSPTLRTPPPARRSLRRRRPPRMDDFAEYGDDEDDLFYYQHLSTDEEAGKEDVVDDEEESEGAERSRREKKFKLLQKLPNHHHHRRRSLSPSSSSSSEEGGGAGGREPLKKGRESGAGRGGGGDEDNYEDGGDLRCDGSVSGSDAEEDGGRRATRKCDHSASGKTMDQFPLSTPLPDKKMLEAILDKLQKKDIYGVYAEPVDPEELPDYHDIIKHPMDFGTIRKKLVTGVYCNLEQFESDVFLLCTNAMQYNAPDTIYFRQARSIQELAKKKFQSIRFDGEGAAKSEQKPQSNSMFDSEDVARSEQKPKSNSLSRKLRKKSLCKTAQVPGGSDISLAATCIATDDACGTGHKAEQPSPPEQPVTVNGFTDSSLTCENKSEKGDEHSAKNSPAKLERKPDTLYEDRRATYDPSHEQPVIQSDSLLTTFENEQKHLVAVGVDAPYSYARSLARFAGPLGPIAWKIASEKIEKALPEGVKFGPGWVGEYEPLPTPILSFESQPGSSELFPQMDYWKERRKEDGMKYAKPGASMVLQSDIGVLSNLPHVRGFNDGSQPMIMNASVLHCKPPDLASSRQSKTKVGANISSSKSESVVDIAARLYKPCSEVTNSRVPGMVSGSKSNKLSETDLICYQSESAVSRVVNRSLFSGKDGQNIGGSSRQSICHGFISTNRTNALDNCFGPGGPEKALGDPIELMRSMPGLSPGSNHVAAVPTAAPVWMSAAGRSSKQVRESPDNLKMQADATSLGKISYESLASVCGFHNNMRPTPSVPQLPNQVVGEECHTPSKSLTVCPQFIESELPRSWGQIPWQGLTPNVQNKKDVCSPDLNITFSAPKSPVLQSSGILVDSQQPDLALQL